MADRRRPGEAVEADSQSLSAPIEAVKIPTSGKAMEYALAVDGLWQDPDAEHDRIRPPSKVLWSRPSNEARYLRGF